MIDPRAHIAEMRREKYWIDGTGRLKGKNPLASDLQDSIQHLAEGLYSKDVHFIFELIQNAEDNTYEVREPFLSFRLTKSDPTGTKNSDGALIVQNNEVGFSADNVNAICSVGKTTKSKIQGYIGEKGIGFKSVFRVTTNPHIFSNGYCFRLPEHDVETGLGYIVPNWVEDVPKSINPAITTIILPLDKPGFGHAAIEEMLRDIEAETILFLSKLKEIKIETDTGDSLTILKDDTTVPHVQILVEGKSQGESFSIVKEFLLYSKGFDRPIEITHEKRIGIDQREASIAFPLGEGKESVGKIFAYLPVRSDTGLPFLMNADFILTSSREEVREDETWNQWLMCCVAELAGNALGQLKERGLLTIQLLEALARRVKEISEKSIYYPIVQSVTEAFKKEEILPTDDDAFIKANCAKLARGSDLRRLLNRDQLRLLFKSPHLLNWLSADITQDLTPNLRLYLTEQLNIEEVRPGSFIELLTDDFLEKQDDKWIIDFYSFLGKDRANLWKKPDAVLRKKKIIRLEDNTHVVPFKSDGTPNAYLPSTANTNFPTVKRTIFEAEPAADFLKQLGIIPPDLFAEIIEFILPKYTENKTTVDLTENISDLKKIRKVLSEPYQGDSESTISKLRILLVNLGFAQLEDYFSANAEPGKLIPLLLQRLVLPSIRILKASNGHSTAYKAPKDIYANNDELNHYFLDNADAWFFCRDYPGEIGILSHELGINEMPKVKKRDADKNGFVKISESHGHHRRGIKGFDPDIKVDGLEYALASLTMKRSEYIWNKIAIKYWYCTKGIIERSSKKTYENSQKETQKSTFGDMLINTAWLPSPKGGFSKPNLLSLNDLPVGFEKDTPLAKSLSVAIGMKQPEHEKALEIVTGGDPDLRRLIEHYQSAPEQERIKMLKSLPKEVPPDPAPSFKNALENFGRTQHGAIEKGTTSKTAVSNPDRYQDKLNENVNAEVQEYISTPRKITFSPVKNDSSNVEARRFLYEEYRGYCQITNSTFPKASGRSGGTADNYFEACAITSYANANYLNNPGNMLCVSADTMAKLKYASVELLEDFESVIRNFQKSGESAEYVFLKIRLAGEDNCIRWSQRHFMRLVALYEET